MIAELKTSLNPFELLNRCLEVEQQMGRVRVIHWGPRVIDIDVVLVECFNSKKEELLVPHPRMWERAFVMIPLLELIPDNEKDFVSSPLLNEILRHKPDFLQLKKEIAMLERSQGVIKIEQL